MSHDPWAPQQQEARVYFAKCEMTREEIATSNGGSYMKMQIFLTPIEPDQEIIDRTFFDFGAQWQKITVPSALKLVQAGKIASPGQLENAFVAYRWTEYRSYATRDIKYWKERDPDKLAVDDQGRSYKPLMALEFLDVFPNDESWRKAYESSETYAAPPPQANPQLEAAKSALPAIVQNCGTDMKKLMSTLDNPPFKDVLTVESPEVKLEVSNLVAHLAGDVPAKQESILAEINGHFNTDTPYLTTEDIPELPF